MGLILEGKMWLYKLLDVLKRLYPGQAGKDSVDKMVDVIMECSDKHYKGDKNNDFKSQNACMLYVSKIQKCVIQKHLLYFAAFGPMTPFHCYREKKMWHCIYKSAEVILNTFIYWWSLIYNIFHLINKPFLI